MPGRLRRDFAEVLSHLQSLVLASEQVQQLRPFEQAFAGLWRDLMSPPITRLRLVILFIFTEYRSESSVRLCPARLELDRLPIACLRLGHPASGLQRLRRIRNGGGV